MKVLLLNGSSSLKGCTCTTRKYELLREDVIFEIFQIGAEPLRDCIGCGGCRNGCSFVISCVNLWKKQKKQMALYLAHQFIMRIQAAALCHF